MASTFFGLNIGQTGLYAYQAALDTTAHNISNAETEGYTRQVMGQRAGKALRVNNSYGMAGTGVTITGVKQLRDEYYDIKYWKNNTMFGEYSGKSHYMTEIENYFNEVSVEGFNDNFNSMFNSMQELIKNPSSLTVRTQMTNYAKSLTEYFNSLSASLKGIQEECNFEIKNKVDQINSTAQQISALTKQINTLEISGTTANDLRDQRALLIDELSEIASVTVSEKTVGDGIGVTSYVVKIDGQTLVDGNNYNTLKLVPRQEKLNQNDVDGLYDITWSNGQKFNTESASLGGTLKGLFEVRDGNNADILRGTVSEGEEFMHVYLTDTTVNSVEKLNIPEYGRLTIGNREYKYTGFQVTKDSEGKFIYDFELESPLIAGTENSVASVGKSINYKGIPYYLDQLNEFVRTFAKSFNYIHREGLDLDGNKGIDFFNATNKISGRNYEFEPYEGAGDTDNHDFSVFNSQTGGYYESIPEDQPLYGSYYFMTAENFTISNELLNNPKRFATARNIVDGSENNDIVDDLLALKIDKSMFKSGAPGGFIQTLVAEIGIDTDKANRFSENQENILASITSQRLSVSGVDVDEEAMNLVKFQNAYNLSAKVISVMDEIYDKLINYMGV